MKVFAFALPALSLTMFVAGGCAGSSCPSKSFESKSENGFRYHACVDGQGRFHGTARASKEGDAVFEVRGQYDRDTPTGTWTCKRGGESMNVEFDAKAFRKQLWGLETPPPGAKGGRHLGPLPFALCPEGGWEALAEEGIEIPTGANLKDLGVATVSGYVGEGG